MKMKFKKIKLITVGIATLTGIFLAGSVVGIVNNNSIVLKNDSIKNKERFCLIDINQNQRSVIKKITTVDEASEELSTLTINNTLITKWIDSIYDNNLNFNQASYSLYELNISKVEKDFMFNNLVDKYYWQKMDYINSVTPINAKNNNLRRLNYLRSKSKEFLRNEAGNLISPEGTSTLRPEIHTNGRWMDRSYIRYSNQDVYNVYLLGLDKTFVSHLEKGMKKVGDVRHAIDFVIRITKEFGVSYKAQKKIQIAFKSLITFIKSIDKDINYLRQNMKSLELIGIDLDDFDMMLSFTDYFKVASITDIIRITSNLFLPNLIHKISEIPEFGIPITVISSLLFELLNSPSGNGYTFFENLNDSRLNDWKYQIKNNLTNMSVNSFRMSRGYDFDKNHNKIKLILNMEFNDK